MMAHIKSSSLPNRYTGRIGVNSRRLVFEEFKRAGLPLCYESDAYNDDLPYWVTVNGEGQLIIPYTLDCNDMKVRTPEGVLTPFSGFSLASPPASPRPTASWAT